jgi:hypothetical protein
MADEKKYTAKEAAQAVLKKAEEMLKAHKHIGWGKLHGKLEREGYSEESADKIAGAIKAKVHPAAKSEVSDKSLEKATSHAYTGSRDTQTGHEKGVNTHAYLSNVHPNEGVSHAGDWLRTSGSGKRAAKEIAHRKLEELRAMPKPNLTKEEAPGKEIHPKEHMEGEAMHPKERIESQKDPQHNEKEQAEGNNELAGTTPTQVGQDGKNIPGYDEMKGYVKLAKFMGRMEHKRSKKEVL